MDKVSNLISILAPIMFGAFAHFPAHADMEQHTERCLLSPGPTPENVVESCTALLLSGTLSDENKVAALSNRGIGNSMLGRFADALQDYSQALTIDPKIADLYLLRCSARIKMDQHYASIQDCTQAVLLNPNDAQAFVTRAIAYENQGRLELALKDLRRAIFLKPGELSFYSGRVTIYVKLKQYGNALRDLETIISADPQNASAYNAKAWILATANDASIRDGAEAVIAARRAFELDGSHEHRDTLAAAYAENGNFQAAISEQTQAMYTAKFIGESETADEFEERLLLYRKGQPFRQD